MMIRAAIIDQSSDADDGKVDVSEWLAVHAGDWIRAEVRPGADTGCKSFQGVVESVDDDWRPSVKMVNSIRRYWANWKLLERRPAE